MIVAQPICTLSNARRGGSGIAPGQDRMWAWGFVWDGAGRLTDRLDPRGVRAATRYTPEGWVDDITVSYPDLPDETVDYNSYDALGSPLRIDFPEGITRPVFDARSRVTGATHQGGRCERGVRLRPLRQSHPSPASGRDPARFGLQMRSKPRTKGDGDAERASGSNSAEVSSARLL